MIPGYIMYRCHENPGGCMWNRNFGLAVNDSIVDYASVHVIAALISPDAIIKIQLRSMRFGWVLSKVCRRLLSPHSAASSEVGAILEFRASFLILTSKTKFHRRYGLFIALAILGEYRLLVRFQSPLWQLLSPSFGSWYALLDNQDTTIMRPSDVTYLEVMEASCYPFFYPDMWQAVYSLMLYE